MASKIMTSKLSFFSWNCTLVPMEMTILSACVTRCHIQVGMPIVRPSFFPGTILCSPRSTGLLNSTMFDQDFDSWLVGMFVESTEYLGADNFAVKENKVWRDGSEKFTKPVVRDGLDGTIPRSQGLNSISCKFECALSNWLFCILEGVSRPSNKKTTS